METWVVVVLIVVALLIGFAIGASHILFVPHFKEKRAQGDASRIIHDAELKASKLAMNAKLDAKAEIAEMKANCDQDVRERKVAVIEQERNLNQRELNIDKKDQILLAKEQSLDSQKENYNAKIESLKVMEQNVQIKLDSIIDELQSVAHMSTNEAKEEIMKRVEERMSKEITTYIKNREDEAEEECDTKSREIISLAIAKYSQGVTSEQTISNVVLPSEDMKGRIIGREGRNIKSLEALLGVDIIIDDTPEVITVSCFNPIRREIARLTLEALIKDGRIQPSRIEEIIAKVTAEMDVRVRKIGESTCAQLGITRVNRELYKYIGQLKYRTSYGQNALDHSIQVAVLTGVMAAELGLDQTLAKRAGFFHDIGKAADFEVEGSHVEVGARLAKKYGEGEVVINAIESHHGDKPAKFVISTLVEAADTLSAARPGARSETLENYVQRIEQLETLCKGFAGVSNCFAMQSGREVRVSVIPDKVDDTEAFQLARDIREKIEAEMTYPGQVKVQVIRELRAVEIAK